MTSQAWARLTLRSWRCSASNAFNGGEPTGSPLYLIYVTDVSICDVGPRDGLQNEARTLEPSVRASLCDRLAVAGVKKMEAASFVNPKLVPQMGGAEEVMSALH